MAPSRAGSLLQFDRRWAPDVCPAQTPYRSEPARDGGLAFNIDVAWHDLIASKLSSYRDWWRTQNLAAGEDPIVGAGLPAMTVGHSASKSPGMASSRAGSLLQFDWRRAPDLRPAQVPCRSKACSRWRSDIQHRSCLAWPHREQAQLLQGLVAHTQSRSRRRSNCRSGCICKEGLAARPSSSECRADHLANCCLTNTRRTHCSF